VFAVYGKPAQAYATVGMETGVASADPHRLILMLFDGAIVAVANAKRHMQQGDIAAKGQATSHAIDIVTNGLRVSLDMDAGGELAERLGALYDYIAARLLQGNARNDAGALDEAMRLLIELREAWAVIAGDKTNANDAASIPAGASRSAL
jgi:flagellar protein FliS